MQTIQVLGSELVEQVLHAVKFRAIARKELIEPGVNLGFLAHFIRLPPGRRLPFEVSHLPALRGKRTF